MIERWSQDELRSVNAHIEFLLRDAARRYGRLPNQNKENSDINNEGQKPFAGR
ncbi:toxin-antitoxin system HicB family antitoxin [Alicyclobacillus herbarius]|uniref:toxin-antitoxin system HicB family antitoxin n=1 Tax=Alicyclobacillus herbarius TaxID=122960 RepID=UPI002354AE66|nr:toxin-antitoxin system HicB family antitoxin [Alicyclobacillus herbarius]